MKYLYKYGFFFLLVNYIILYYRQFEIINQPENYDGDQLILDDQFNSNLVHRHLNTGYQCNGAWAIGMIHFEIIKKNNNSFIFNVFNNRSLKYNNYTIYNCDDIKSYNLTSVSYISQPFIYKFSNDKLYLFYQYLNFDKNISQIGVSVSIDEGNSWEFLGIVLDEEFNLSYPSIFNCNYNYIYMTASSTNSDLIIYRTRTDLFPFNWTVYKSKLTKLNKQWYNTNIIYYNNTYFIFTTGCDFIDNNNCALYIYYINENKDVMIENDWFSHYQNPFYLNDNNIYYYTSAGTPYYDTSNNILYRFTTDGINLYIFTVTKLNRFEFEEHLLNTIAATIFDNDIVHRLHHIHIHSNIIAFDFGSNIRNFIYETESIKHFDILGINVLDLQFIDKLPKLIHFVWISENINDNNQLDIAHKENIDTFYKLYLPTGWKIIVWTNKNVRNIFCKNSYTFINVTQVDKICNYLTNQTLSAQYSVTLSIKSDILRYLILYEFGGMYFDADFYAIKNMDTVLDKYIDKHGLIVCNEIAGQVSFISGGFFAAYPNHKCVKTARDNIMNKIQLVHLTSDTRTGPAYWKESLVACYYYINTTTTNITRELMKEFNISLIATQLPTDYMYAFKYNDDEKMKLDLIHSDKPNVYTIHLWDGSWLEKTRKYNDLWGNFLWTVNEQYPFRQGWLFDDYKYKHNEIINIEMHKFTYAQWLITEFKLNELKFPFYNPSIIKVNYKNFKLKDITNHALIQTINQTSYILIGTWFDNQCEVGHVEANFYFDIIRAKYEGSGSGIILLDKNFNILQSVLLIIKDNKLKLHNCRLFVYKSLIFSNCISNDNDYILDLLVWQQTIINDVIQIVAYLESPKYLFYEPHQIHLLNNEDKIIKNLIALQYDEKLYFQWDLKYSYFINVNITTSNKIKTKKLNAGYAYHTIQSNQFFHFNNNVTSYHQSCGFIHLPHRNEFLAIAHIHYDLYDFLHIEKPFNNIEHEHHYTHFFYTIIDKPPFFITQKSSEFCFNSPYIQWNTTDCDVIQIVNGMVQNEYYGEDYLFISYGINDCISSIALLDIKFVLSLLKPIN